MEIFRNCGFPHISRKQKTLTFFVGMFLLSAAFIIAFNTSEEFRNFTGNVISSFSGPEYANITIDFENEVGVIRDDFYGVSNFNGYLSDLSYVTSSGGWSLFDTPSNETHTRQAFIDANLKIFRSWAFLTLLSSEEGVLRNLDSDATYHATLWNVDALTDQNKWAYENDKIMMYNIAGMPEWLADKSTGWCTDRPIDGLYYSDHFLNTNWSSCSPTNYTKYQEVVTELAMNISNNCEYADHIWFNIGNEMEQTNWLDNLPADDPLKAAEFVKLYEHTYDALDPLCDGRFTLGGASGLRFFPNMHHAFLANMSDKMDYYSENIYSDWYNPYIETTTIDYRVEQIIDNCELHGANCDHIIISEWGYIFNSEDRDDYMNVDVGYVYLTMLRKYPANISLAFHEYMLPVNGSDYHFISEPSLSDAFYNPYNVTKDFATYHAGGEAVVTSNADLSTIHVVVSKESNGTGHISIINEGGDTDVTLLLENSANLTFTDVKTGQNYSASNNSVAIGVIDMHKIRHFTFSDSIVSGGSEEPPPQGASSSSGGSSSSSSSGGSSSSSSSGGSSSSSSSGGSSSSSSSGGSSSSSSSGGSAQTSPPVVPPAPVEPNESNESPIPPQPPIPPVETTEVAVGDNEQVPFSESFLTGFGIFESDNEGGVRNVALLITVFGILAGAIIIKVLQKKKVSSANKRNQLFIVKASRFKKPSKKK